MPPERPTGDARRPRVRPDVALQPPPRPGTASAPSPGAEPARRPFPHATVAPVVLGLSMLAAVAAGVFILLPRWVASRTRPVAVATPASAQAPAPPPTAAPRPPVVEAPVLPERPVEEPPAEEPAEELAVEEAPVGAAPARAAADPGTSEWTRAMSEGLAALDRGEFAEARAALARAEAARPGATATADAIARAEEGLKGVALAGHHARGGAAEAREEWRAAVGEYEAALKVEPQVAFALEGRARALPRAQMDERLAAYLQKPDRLGTASVAREAEAALATARAVGAAGPRLREQTAALERMLKDARTEVTVRLLSDGVTEVVVLRVGTLGTFRERTIVLRPGSYVVTGRRQGYRDTRKTLVVSSSQAPPPLDVRCTEAL